MILARGAAALPEMEAVEIGEERTASWRGRRRAGSQCALDAEAVQTRCSIPAGPVAGTWEALGMTRWQLTPKRGNVDKKYEPWRRAPSASQAGAARGMQRRGRNWWPYWTSAVAFLPSDEQRFGSSSCRCPWTPRNRLLRAFAIDASLSRCPALKRLTSRPAQSAQPENI